MADVNKVNWNDLFYYDESSPSCLRRIHEVRTGNGYRIVKSKAGDIVGAKNKVLGYWETTYNGNTYKCHRIVWVVINGKIPEGLQIDHIDGNKENNKITNLRLVTKQVNAQNQKLSEMNTSGHTGVSLNTSRNKDGTVCRQYWCAQWYYFPSNKKGWKYFSVNKYGYDEAFRLALEYRIKMIEEQNNNGASYTDDHGVRN